MENTAQAFSFFYSVIERLRAPDGCPWDREQTPLSLRNTLIEESFETVDAITQQDAAHAKEELGDLLLNGLLISYIYQQQGDFTVAKVMQEVAEKLIRRHPHVFKESEGRSQLVENITTGQQVVSQWDAIKEKVEGRKEKSILDEVPQGFPPLLKALKYQKKAAKKAFDWESPSQVMAKVMEELGEVQAAAAQKEAIQAAAKSQASSGEKCEALTTHSTPQLDAAQLHLEEELGDLLFAVTNLCRHYQVDPNAALSATNAKFYRRFRHVEQTMEEQNIPMTKENFQHMDELWEEAKKLERNR
ncbi:MAG: nucleoside triphosphate pyrophosphohydrolase [Spirochaetaceae bacterium]|nr:nucleoside triphosphate pyrophosphohydrolase [Spirochaetaceae bacterium]